MKEKLNLSDEQEQMIRSLMFQRVELNSQFGLDLIMGKITAD